MPVPEMFPGVNMEQQKKLLIAASELWRTQETALDSLSSSVRFGIIPKQSLTIINFAVCIQKYSCYKAVDVLRETLTANEMHTFILRLSRNLDLWVLPPIVRCGFKTATRFLSIFGGHSFYAEQLLLENTPFSLCQYVIGIIGDEGIKQLRKQFSYSQRARIYFQMPTLEEFEKCIPKKKKKRCKNV